MNTASELNSTVFVIRGKINGVMNYARGYGSGNALAVKPSEVGIYEATLFTHRTDAVNALDSMRHGDAILMEIVKLETK
jgi:hypothetical protein